MRQFIVRQTLGQIKFSPGGACLLGIELFPRINFAGRLYVKCSGLPKHGSSPRPFREEEFLVLSVFPSFCIFSSSCKPLNRQKMPRVCKKEVGNALLVGFFPLSLRLPRCKSSLPLASRIVGGGILANFRNFLNVGI